MEKGNIMNVTLNYHLVRKLFNVLGMDKFIEGFNDAYEDLQLYSMSDAWLNDSKYILKLRGTGGDLVVSWI